MKLSSPFFNTTDKIYVDFLKLTRAWFFYRRTVTFLRLRYKKGMRYCIFAAIYKGNDDFCWWKCHILCALFNSSSCCWAIHSSSVVDCVKLSANWFSLLSPTIVDWPDIWTSRYHHFLVTGTTNCYKLYQTAVYCKIYCAYLLLIIQCY